MIYPEPLGRLPAGRAVGSTPQRRLSPVASLSYFRSALYGVLAAIPGASRIGQSGNLFTSMLQKRGEKFRCMLMPQRGNLFVDKNKNQITLLPQRSNPQKGLHLRSRKKGDDDNYLLQTGYAAGVENPFKPYYLFVQLKLRLAIFLFLTNFFPALVRVLTNRNVLFFAFLFSFNLISAQSPDLTPYNITWSSQSKNSGESMPCGGGDIGMNVWVEGNDLLIYIARSGSFDENNTLLKAGRVRIKLTPNPFENGNFKQELVLAEGCVKITAGQTAIKVWADVFHPVAHVEINSKTPVQMEAAYESWRYKNREMKGRENNQNSWKWAPQYPAFTYQDSIGFDGNAVSFYHRNRDTTVFDATVRQQQLETVKSQLYDPLKNLTSGGSMEGANLQPAGTYFGQYLNTDFKGWKLKSRSASRTQELNIYLHTAQLSNIDDWKNGLKESMAAIKKSNKTTWQQTANWWKQYWNRSFITVHSGNVDTANIAWQVGRNYQLFRYMMGCNAMGSWPTKFNGGLFTYDPSLTNKDFSFTPDFRNWGGGIHTAQNQRLVYFPTIKSGDTDVLKPQLDFYLRLLKNAELRSQTYWQHGGACFTEQLEDFGLPNQAEYGQGRPAYFDAGVEYNAWLEYTWDTVLEFCLMMLEEERYFGSNIKGRLPFIESCLRFFDEHYQQLAKQRGRKTLDGNGHLVLYPGSAAETYKMAYNANSTIAALQTVVQRLLQLPEAYADTAKRKEWTALLNRIPPISFRQINGHTTIAPAQAYERINNEESVALYPVFPWGIYGVGKPGLDTAMNTWLYDTSAQKFRSHAGWKQDAIWAARLGMADSAAHFTFLKLKNSGRRFPAFWGPGFDWTPDHNWGGSGAIALQEMLMQVDGKRILLFPAWPKKEDVHFKLHAPYNTTVEAELKNGKVELLKVVPAAREKDIEILLK